MIYGVFQTYLRYILCAALVFLGSRQVSHAQDFGFTSARKYKTIPFKFVNNLIIIPLYIEGKGPFNFVLDTGVGLCLITEPHMVDSLGKKSSRMIKINGIGEGNELSALVYPNTEIEIASTIVGFSPIAVLKEDPFNLSAFVGMPIHGLIGYDLFNSFIISINYSSKTIRFYNSRRAHISQKGKPIPIRIEEKKPYIQTSLRLSDGKREAVKLIIDTGSGHPLSLETRDGISYEVPEKSISANLGVGLSGIVSGFISRIPTFNLGKFRLKEVICAFPNYASVAAKMPTISRNGSLGNSVLKRFHVVFDYQREVMYLKPNYMFKELFEHDMSGVELIADGPNYDDIIVARVEQGSPAAINEIKKGDRILGINFKPIKEWSMEELHSLFRSKEDKRILIEIQSPDKQPRILLMLLKRRI